MAPFVVFVAADLNGKCNFEFRFAARPPVAEFAQRVDVVLGTEAALRRGAAQPMTPFELLRIQVFDERIEMWVDLVSAGQLHSGCQCYCFQPQTAWHRESSGPIPPPVRPINQSAWAGAMEGAAVARPMLGPASPTCGEEREASAMSQSGAVDSVFRLLDSRGAGRLSLADWTAAMARFRFGGEGGTFSSDTVSDLFAQADSDQDGFVSPCEWEDFAARYPQLADAILFRDRAARREQLRSDNAAAAERVLRDLEEQRDAARQDAANAELEVAEQERALQRTSQDIAGSRAAEAASRQGRGEADQEAEGAAGGCRCAFAAREQARAQAGDCEGALAQHTRAAEAAGAELRDERQRLQRTDEELARLRAALAEKEEERAQLQRRVSNSEQAAAAAQRTLQDLQRDADAAVAAAERATAAASAAEGRLRSLRSAADERTSRLAAAQRAVLEAESERARAEQGVVAACGRRDALHSEALRAAAACEEQQSVIRALKHKDEALRKKRKGDEEEENRLLVAECVLNEQHAAVERRRLALRQAHSDFVHGSGRTAGAAGFTTTA